MNRDSLSRRRFLQTAAMTSGAVAGIGLGIGTASAAAPVKLSPADPAAKALLYTEDTTKVDKKNPMAARHAPNQKCSNCAQVQGKPGDKLRPCGIFPGKLVAAEGWCSVWAKKA